jgi:hypothetical protein
MELLDRSSVHRLAAAYPDLFSSAEADHEIRIGQRLGQTCTVEACSFSFRCNDRGSATSIGLVKVAKAHMGASRADQYAALIALLFLCSALAFCFSIRWEPNSTRGAIFDRISDLIFVCARAPEWRSAAPPER